MSEIKVVKSEVEPAFADLKNKIQALDTTNPNCTFSKTQMNVTTKMLEIEKLYYEILGNYKTIITTVESDAWESIEAILQTDQNLSRITK